MYEAHFGLRQEPFSIAPDPRFLYLSEKHREALAHLNYGLSRGASFVLLTGEIGAGKTTVWRKFLEDLPSNFDVASVVNPKLSVDALLGRICEDLRVPLPTAGRPVDLIDALHGHVLLAAADGRRTLIVIDEAQALSMDVLEQLRLLTNLDTSGCKLQVLLIAQPELRQMLEQPQLEPLAQRVVTRYHLPALSEAETASYIEHRLLIAGLKGAMPFDGEALGMIHRLCRGVPRRINVLCDRALLGAQASGSRRVDRQVVERAAAAVLGHPHNAPAAAPAPPRALVLAAVAGAALVAGVWLAPRLDGPAEAALAAGGAADSVAAPPPAARAAVSAPPETPQTPQAATTAVALATPTPPAASNAATAAPAATPSAAPVPMPDAGFTLAAATADEAQAWRTLALQWGVVLPEGDPCSAAPLQALHCHRVRGGLAPVRQLDRPGLLKLTDERGRSAHVMMTALQADSATLLLGGVPQNVPLAQLALLWRGEFATFWRAPPGYSGLDVAAQAIVLAPWLAQRLARVDGGSPLAGGEAALSARVAAFQLEQGLMPDGLAGPLTLMQLSRASGIDEPRLQPRP